MERRPQVHLGAKIEGDVAEKRGGKQRPGREVTTDAILDAAGQLFAARGYSGVTVREIAERAGVSHALVHQYVGSKADILRGVLTRNEGTLVSSATGDRDLLESTGRILLRVLEPSGRTHARLLTVQPPSAGCAAPSPPPASTTGCRPRSAISSRVLMRAPS